METGATILDSAHSRTQFVPTASTRRRDHRFYTAMALAISAGVFAGFSRTYYARSYFHSPEIPLWLHIHGAFFTGWIFFYIMQNLLAMNGGMALHRRLGIVGVVLATGVVLLGSATAIRQARQGRVFPFPDIYSTVGVSLAQMALFAVFITVGLLRRRDGETHKRLIMMATQLFFFPAFGRLLQGINPVTLLLALGFYFAGPVYDLITRRSIHRAYRWGVPLLILTTPPFGVMASHGPLWRHFVDWMVS